MYVLAYRHPLVVAKGFATLDHLSGGRAIVGVGTGHVEGEFDALGVPFVERGRITDEKLPELADALEHTYVGDVGARPRPVQSPRPPIWIGGSGRPALRRAARYDGWLPQGPATAEAIATIAALREAGGLADRPFTVGHVPHDGCTSARRRSICTDRATPGRRSRSPRRSGPRSRPA